jgi:peptidoglycan/LPS O-acetylase OafA/YrhL
VVLQHFSATVQQHSAVTIPSLVPHGYLAVDLFFALSGFIMAYTYLADFSSRGMSAYGPFLARRVARIVPLNTFALGLVVFAGVICAAALGRNMFHASTNPLFDIPANLLMLQGIGIGTNMNGPSWSISVEFVAYLLFPLLLWLVFSSQPLCLLTSFGAILALAVAASLHQRLGLYGETAGFGLLRCLCSFTLGLASYRAYRAPWMHFARADWPAACLILWTASFMVAGIDLPAVLAFPGLILCLAHNRGRIAALLDARIPYFLGVISFSIYLLHNLFRPIALALLQMAFPAPLPGPAAMAFAAFGSMMVLPFAWLAYVAVEHPGRALVRNGFHALRLR